MVASVSADTENLHALDAFAAFGAVFAADAVKTALALAAKLIVCAVFAFFAARHTDYGAVGASVTAVTDLVYTVFT